MGEPWTEDGGRMNVTEQVEIAEGEFFASKYRTARGLRWCASNQITDGGSSVGPVHRVSHRSLILGFRAQSVLCPILGSTWLCCPSVRWPHVSATC